MSSPDSLTKLLNQRLQISSRRRSYTSIKVVILYWEDGDDGFRNEGQELGGMFRQVFEYEVLEYAIPSIESQLSLYHFLYGTLLAMKRAHREQGDASLLIIHYGGHGDDDDDRKNGGVRRSVWAAHASGPPTLQWYRIQDDIKNAGIDVLLLLDCCFAAQAGRAHEEMSSKFELLAASAMGMKTPLPGDRSFTKALIRHMTEEVHQSGQVRIIDLHKSLMHRQSNLYATPIYANLSERQQSIILAPRPTMLLPHPIRTESGVCFQLEFWTPETLHQSFLDVVTTWLGESAPRGISAVKIQRVLQNTTQIQRFVTTSLHSDQPLAQVLERSALDDIQTAWNKLSTLITRYNVQQISESQRQISETVMKQRFLSFIETLEASNAIFSDSLECHVMKSNKINDSAFFSRVLEDPMASELGIVDQLQLRQIINFPNDFTMSNSDAKRSKEVFHEYRVYSQYIDPTDLPDLEVRVAHLARLLNQPKDSKFLSLQCCNWIKEHTRHRFILEFAVPDHYQTAQETYHTLFSVICKLKGTDRPTLNERLKIALMLTKGIQSWHSVGWLHQGISSHNVLFLTRKGETRPDYTQPFLQGFQFSRPDDESSIGRAVDNLASAVYRHPHRQGASRKAHTRMHDIYSLGVVLLELGLWQSAFEIANISKRDVDVVTADQVQSRLQIACNSRLAHYAGLAYKQTVEACLASTFDKLSHDHKNAAFAATFYDMAISRLADGVQL